MNSFSAIVILAVVCFCNAEEVAETKLGQGKQLFRPFFIPLIPVSQPATAAPGVVTVAPTVAPATGGGASNKPSCPGRCCKKYCLQGNFCTAGAAGAAPTCDPATVTPKKCFNSLSSGCSAAECTPSSGCSTECGAVMNIAPIAICP